MFLKRNAGFSSLEIQIILLSEYRRRQKQGLGHRVVWLLSTGPIRRKQKSVLVKQKYQGSDYCVGQTDALCEWLLLLLTAANMRSHCHRLSWCTDSGQRQDCPQDWPLNQHGGIFSERLSLCVRETDLGLSCIVSITASHRMRRLPMTSRQSLTSHSSQKKRKSDKALFIFHSWRKREGKK